MIPDDQSTSAEFRDQSTGHSVMAAAAFVLFVVAMLLGATLYALGQTIENFRWDTFRNGGLLFVAIVTCVTAAAVLLAFTAKAVSTITPPSLKGFHDRRRLRQARQRTLRTIDRRRQLQEEQARLTAMMQASFLFEKEATRLTNSQAIREFQKALQSGVVRSCEVVFNHLNNSVEQYEQVVAEIESSTLSAAEKTELLNTLTRQLDVPGLNQRHQTAQKMMEDAIWRVRFRKARLLARRNPDFARRYLQSLRHSETSHRILIQLESLLSDL